MQVDDVGEDTISQLTPLLKAGKQHTEWPLCLAKHSAPLHISNPVAQSWVQEYYDGTWCVGGTSLCDVLLQLQPVGMQRWHGS